MSFIIIIIITVDRLDSKDNIKLMLSVITQWAEKSSYLCNSLPKQQNRKGRTAKSFILE